jgi:type I restriction enzyme S subunit
MTSVYVGEEPVVFGGFVFRGRPRTSLLDPGFSQYVLRSSAVRAQIIARSQGAIRANVGQRDLKSVRVFLPGKPEQEAIASVLDDIRSSIVRQSALVAKKRAMHLGLTQALLTGRIRLPGFAADWKRVPIAEVLEQRTERNAAAALEVLSCTKHQGFVRSLDFFKNQVFSRDLSNYLVIHHGDIGYPANHVEEGSIGVQELAERGLVSPIYVVMRPVRGTDSFFLHRQLKLDSFRQEFARATNASVNRRGSLRWPEFSRINVSVPEPDEQRAIASAIRDVEAEIAQLQREVEKLRSIKQGVAQRLLDGSTRLPGMGAAA